MKKACFVALVLALSYTLVACDGPTGPDPKDAAAKAALKEQADGKSGKKTPIRAGNEGD